MIIMATIIMIMYVSVPRTACQYFGCTKKFMHPMVAHAR
jgi:hypothetical protein